MTVTGEELQLIEQKTGVRLNASEVRRNRFMLKEQCPFLKDNCCTIYAVRPCQCRLYHCGRLKLTEKRLETLAEIRELMLNNVEYYAFKEEIDGEAVAWGNAHGWNWRKIT